MTSTQADISPKSLVVSHHFHFKRQNLSRVKKTKTITDINDWGIYVCIALLYAYRKSCNHAKFHVVDKTSFPKTKRKKKRNFIETLLRLFENITIKKLLPLSLRRKISPTLPWKKNSVKCFLLWLSTKKNTYHGTGERYLNQTEKTEFLHA